MGILSYRSAKGLGAMLNNCVKGRKELFKEAAGYPETMEKLWYPETLDPETGNPTVYTTSWRQGLSH